jgi:prepilin-type N-terminal cleavage/methylation domain-containing protein
MKNSSKGFTLIELIVVMAIIAVLAGMSLFALPGARSSARDGRRQGDLQQIAAALEIYKADFDQYPSGLPAPGLPLQNGGNTYIQSMPGEPLGGGYFYTRPSTVTFILCSTLEEPPTPPNDTSGCVSCSGGSCQLKVTNP